MLALPLASASYGFSKYFSVTDYVDYHVVHSATRWKPVCIFSKVLVFLTWLLKLLDL